MSVTHATGLARRVNCAVVCATFLFSLMAMAAMVVVAMMQPVAAAVGNVVYGITLVICSLCSYFYTIRIDLDGSRLWRHLDHAGIFLLIAGTYTPFALNVVGLMGIKLIYPIWILALLGVALRLIIRRGYERLFVGLYILIGWVFVTALPGVIAAINHTSLVLLGAGALAYTIGAILFARDIGRWTDPVWHGFVFAGAYLHFLAVLYAVVA